MKNFQKMDMGEGLLLALHVSCHYPYPRQLEYDLMERLEQRLEEEYEEDGEGDGMENDEEPLRDSLDGAVAALKISCADSGLYV